MLRSSLMVFFQIITMRSKSEAGTKLDRINRDVGVANMIFMENSPEQTGYKTETQRVARLAIMEVQTTESYSPRQNKYESDIKIIKVKAKRRRFQRNKPKRVWDFVMVWEAEINSCTSGKYGRTYLERLTWDTINISESLEFEFYELVWFWNNQ